MAKFFLFLFGFIILLPNAASAYAGRTYFTPHDEYETQIVTTFRDKYNDRLTLERAWTKDEEITHAYIQRFQVRNERGEIVAYTPTRVTGIPVCFGRNTCWIFLWKSVYPGPAIFKLNLSHPVSPPITYLPVEYTRKGPWFEGFDEKTFNPVLSIIGVFLFMVKFIWYFCCCIFLTIILCLQVVRYRELPEVQQKWIKRVIAFLVPGPLPIPVEPYIITAFLIMTSGWRAFEYLGIPFVLTIVTVFCTFFLCCMRLAETKKRRKG